MFLLEVYALCCVSGWVYGMGLEFHSCRVVWNLVPNNSGVANNWFYICLYCQSGIFLLGAEISSCRLALHYQQEKVRKICMWATTSKPG